MNFIFINRFYWPEEPATAQLLTDLAEALATRRHSVTVIARLPDAPGTPSTEFYRGVTVRRVRTTYWARHGLVGKCIDSAAFYFGALVRLTFTARRGVIVVALTDPPLLGIGVWLVARLRGAQIIHWVQDIYPEVALALTHRRWPRVLRPLRNVAWRRSDACVTLGADMAAVLARAGVPPEKILISPNWAPRELAPQPAAAARSLRADWNLTGKFVALYSGNLGRVHDLAPLLDVAEHLRAHPHIAIVFVGAGAQHASLVAEARRRGLPNLHFHPPQPRARLAESLALGDLHFVTVRAGCESSVFPSKIYGCAAVGRPVLFIGPPDCEIARMIATHGFGRALSRDDTAAIAAAIAALSETPGEWAALASTAVAFSRLNGGVERAASQWAALAGASAGP